MSNPEYNEICYIARYPDIKNGYIFAGTDGVWFYQSNLVKGWVVQKKKLSDNAFWHWQNFGLAEGRVCGCDLPGTIYSNEFNAAAYLARYADVRVSPDWRNNPLGHYQSSGIYEGRHPGFEILTSASQIGMVSPGTTTQIVDNPATNLTPGDQTIIVNPLDVLPPDISPIVDITATAPAPAASLSTWIAANPVLMAAIIAGAIIIIKQKKSSPKYYRK